MINMSTSGLTTVPNHREAQLSCMYVITCEQDLALVLATYREELLKEFGELQKDMHALGDTRMASALKSIIDTARGVP
jgi:hypothetical protein